MNGRVECVMVVRADVDNRDRPAAASICHARQQGMDADCGLLLTELRCCPCVCVCVYTLALSCARGGRLEAKINGAVFGCIPVEHLHQSRGLLADLLERTRLCVCVCVCVCVNACMHAYTPV